MSRTKLVITSLLFIPFLAIAHGGENDEVIIQMTSKGFEPKEVTITQGEEVVFKNNDTVSRWPAADFHPTHGTYPEFDPLDGIAPGGYWKFKFDKTGTWRMHDHLIPHFTGTITVTASTSTEGSIPETSKEGFWQSLKNFFKKIFG
jgi:plastocyanin